MKNYIVEIPIAGSCSVQVSAKNEEDAVEKAMEIASKVDIDRNTMADEINEFTYELMETMNSGNVRYYSVDKISVEYIGDDDDYEESI